MNVKVGDWVRYENVITQVYNSSFGLSIKLDEKKARTIRSLHLVP